MSRLTAQRHQLLARIRRIAGQVAGIERGGGGQGLRGDSAAGGARGALNGLLDEIIAGVLLDAADPALEDEVRESVECAGDARVTDLHVWRLGPGGHAAIPELAHVAVETRSA